MPEEKQTTGINAILCYSRDDENYNFRDVGELLEDLVADDALREGTIYYESDARAMTPADGFIVNDILEMADERIYEWVGETYDNVFSHASLDAKQELGELLNAWAAKHVNVGDYWFLFGKTRERTVTAEQVLEYKEQPEALP